MDGIVAVTYRCNSKCEMCYIWKEKYKAKDELLPHYYNNLPKVVRMNVTGGEPFLRKDMDEILKVLKKRADRICISSNGLLFDRIVDVMKENKDIGIRISMDGMSRINDKVRGVEGSFDKALTTLIKLKEIGVKDLGAAITVSDSNYKDLVKLYKLTSSLGVELAYSVIHNAFYFNKMDNEVNKKDEVIGAIDDLICELIRSKKPKEWFRAYFMEGIKTKLLGKDRPLKCTMGTDSFFIDPFGDVHACNVIEKVMGNIKKEDFHEIWTSTEACEIRNFVSNCRENCWMIGSVNHLMRKKIWKPMYWIAKRQIKRIT